jgi:putative mycofactocin binding protein MftB
VQVKYVLNTGTQVRRESFGLLFYTMAGPRLYFLPSGEILEESFFEGNHSLDDWISQKRTTEPVSRQKITSLEKALTQLKEKGVINGI